MPGNDAKIKSEGTAIDGNRNETFTQRRGAAPLLQGRGGYLMTCKLARWRMHFLDVTVTV